MKTILCLPVAAACLLVAACSSPKQLEAERREREHQQDYDSCVNYGALPNTPAFNDCMNEMGAKRYGTTYNNRYAPSPQTEQYPYVAPPPHYGYYR